MHDTHRYSALLELLKARIGLRIAICTGPKDREGSISLSYNTNFITVLSDQVSAKSRFLRDPFN